MYPLQMLNIVGHIHRPPDVFVDSSLDVCTGMLQLDRVDIETSFLSSFTSAVKGMLNIIFKIT